MDRSRVAHERRLVLLVLALAAIALAVTAAYQLGTRHPRDYHPVVQAQATVESVTADEVCLQWSSRPLGAPDCGSYFVDSRSPAVRAGQTVLASYVYANVAGALFDYLLIQTP